MADWQPDEWGLQEESEITAPEGQAGMGYSIRYLLPCGADGFVPMVTVGFYCEDRWQNGGAPSDRDDLALSEPAPVDQRYTIGQVITFDQRRDPEESGLDDWSAIWHNSFWFAQSQPFTDEEIKSVMTHFDRSHGELIAWDGQDTSDAVLRTAVLPIDPQDWETYVLPPQLWKRIDDAVWLREQFETELCAECHLDADAHTVGKGLFNTRLAWCKISDPEFALKIARENAEKGDTTRAANGFSEESLRRERFEAAINALSDAGVLQLEPGEVLWYRSKANREVETNAQAWDRSDGARWLASAFDEIAKAIKASKENHATEV